jgi:3',5'-cyclic AMP phosphodiesterase CpdA
LDHSDSLGTGSSSTQTCRLIWATDIHLNFLKHSSAAEQFGKYLRQETHGQAVVVTGDISTATHLKRHLADLERGLGCPFYFVLGNHDYYNGSFEGSMKIANEHAGWLDRGGVHRLTDHVALVGYEGWYDAFHGNPFVAKFGMSDWRDIADLAQLPGNPFGQRAIHQVNGLMTRTIVVDREARQWIIDACRERSQAYADAARDTLHEAFKTFERVIFATHVPPFEGATWHEGAISDSTWIPWFSSKLMGDTLMDVAQAYPDRKIMVLCGHTHSSGVYDPLPNLRVLTGESAYYAPDTAGIIEIGEVVRVSMKINKTWTDLPPF